MLKAFALYILALRGILERFGGVLGRLGSVLGRLGGFFGRLGDLPISKTKNSTAGKQHSRPLQTTLQRTQTRSWAPLGPLRIQRAAELRTRHRA